MRYKVYDISAEKKQIIIGIGLISLDMKQNTFNQERRRCMLTMSATRHKESDS